MIAKRSLGKSEAIHIDMDRIFLLVASDLPDEVFLTRFSFQSQQEIIFSQPV